MCEGKRIAELGWRRGRVFSSSRIKKIEQFLTHPGFEPTQVGEDDWLVIVSQSCDVVANNLSQEPFVEVLHCHPQNGKPRSQFRNLKSTRQIDFKPHRIKYPDLVLTAHAIKDRYIIPRDELLKTSPDTERYFDQDTVSRIGWWYSLRYSRPAWPEAFVKRINPKRDDFETILRGLNPDIDDVEVRIALSQSDEELPDDRHYSVIVWFVVDEVRWNAENDPLRSKVPIIFSKFIEMLGACHNIDIHEDSDVVGGSDFTWQQTRISDEWNFANLSIELGINHS